MLIGVKDGGSDAVVTANALTNYSYVYARDGNASGIQIARCLTGLGPSYIFNNTVLGGVYFNRNGTPYNIPFSDSCSTIIQPRPANGIAGVFNILQCGAFSTAAEGVYTCIIMSSLMVNELIKFGIFFTGRSESLDLHTYISHHLTNLTAQTAFFLLKLGREKKGLVK